MKNLDEIFEEIKNKENFKVEEIPFSNFDQWGWKNGNIRHSTGKFFTIEGIKVKTNFGSIKKWEQPIINQSEIGILGIIIKKIKGIYYFLMQAKMEPGNINILQLSPTVQATKSNFTQVHKGNKIPYLEYFLYSPKYRIWIDQLQSEQGGKFIKKRNRNMIVEIKENIIAKNNFFWIKLSDIKDFIHKDNFVNMDARSVISTIFNPLPEKGIHTNQKLMGWFIDQKVKYELDVKRIPLSKLKTWYQSDNNISKNNFFSIIGISVEAETREVTSWSQPMIKDLNIGLVGFIKKKIKGSEHYLIQAKVMPGNIDVIDLSPTVSTSNYKKSKVNFIEYFTNVKGKIIYDTLQSEEGGRFYHLQNRNMILDIKEDELTEIPSNYIWMTLNQLMKFMPLGMINIETRSLISAL